MDHSHTSRRPSRSFVRSMEEVLVVEEEEEGVDWRRAAVKFLLFVHVDVQIYSCCACVRVGNAAAAV